MHYWQVRNWDRFQHYKHRSPPWIKLYTALLADYEFGRLQDASKAHLLGIYLLAAKLGNRIPDDPEWVGRQINATTPIDLQLLAAQGFLERTQDASEVLAPGKQSAPPERETERERETDSSPSAGRVETELRAGLTPEGRELLDLLLARANPAKRFAFLADVRRLGPGGAAECGSWIHVADGLREASKKADGGLPGGNLLASCVRNAAQKRSADVLPIRTEPIRRAVLDPSKAAR